MGGPGKDAADGARLQIGRGVDQLGLGDDHLRDGVELGGDLVDGGGEELGAAVDSVRGGIDRLPDRGIARFTRAGDRFDDWRSERWGQVRRALTILDDEGRPATAAEVDVFGDPWYRLRLATVRADARGRAVLPVSGDISVLVRHPGYAHEDVASQGTVVLSPGFVVGGPHGDTGLTGPSAELRFRTATARIRFA